MTARAEIIDIMTEDGVPITGAMWDPAPGVEAKGVDAFLLLPGSNGSFYSQIQRPFALGLAEAGYPALTLSTRGHDVVWLHRPSGRTMGVAGEIISEAVYDIRASLDVLEGRGYKKIGLLGHSMGGIKSFYYLAHEENTRITAFVDLSAPRISRAKWEKEPVAEQMLAGLELAEKTIAEGRGEDVLYFMTGQGRTPMTSIAFLDRFKDTRYDVLENAPKVRVPMIALRGGQERDIMPDGYLEQVLELAKDAKPSRMHTVDAADHFYVKGTHVEAVDHIVKFLHEL